MKLFNHEKPIPPVPEPGFDPGVSPEFTSSFLSRLVFGWLQPLMSLGAKRPLEREDIWLVPEARRTDVLHKQFQEYWAQEVARRDASRLALKNKGVDLDRDQEKGYVDSQPSKSKKSKEKEYRPKLWRALNNTFFWQFWLGGALKEFSDIMQVLQPLVTKAIITFVQDSVADRRAGREPPPLWHGILMAFALAIMGVMSSLSVHHFWHRSTVTAVGCRTCLVTTIYRKGLVLSSKAKQDFSTGKVTNLMSTDSSRIEFLIGYFHVIWTAPVMILLVLILLIINLGPSALVGFLFLSIVGPLQGKLVQALSVIRRKSTLITDARVKLTQEVLQGIRVIKFYGWEEAFLNKLEDLRNKELKYVYQLLISRAGIAAINLTVPVIAATLTFVTYSLAGNELTPAIVFSGLSWFNVMRIPLMVLQQVLSAIVDAAVAFRRIEDLLLAEELEALPPVNPDSEYALTISHANFQWETTLKALTMEDLQKQEKQERNRNALKKIQKKEQKAKERAEKKEIKKLAKAHNISILEAQKLYRQSQEKSTSEQSSETMSVEEKMMAKLAEKDPSPDTESILSAKPDDSNNEKQDRRQPEPSDSKGTFGLRNIDFKIPRGQLVAVVGAVGSGKSSLLNALVGEMRKTDGTMEYGGTIGYCPQSAWIQNATVKNNILFGLPEDEERYRRVIKDCALERDIQILPDGDQTEIGERGINLSGGQKQRVNIARAVYFDADIILLDDPLSAVDAHVGKYLFKNCIMGALQGKTRVLVTHQLHVLPQVDYVICMKDGEIVERGSFQELMNMEGEFSELMKAYGGMEEGDQESEEDAIDQEHGDNVATAKDGDGKEGEASGKKSGKPMGLMSQEERSKGSVQGKVYKGYMDAAGGWYLFFLMVFFLTMTQVAKIGNDLWLSWWTADSFNKSQAFYMTFYAVWGVAQGIFQFINGFYFSVAGAKAAKVLHHRALKNIFRAPTSFFDTTPLGRIINRFSKDVDSCDNLLSESYRMFTGTGSIVLSTFILIAVIFPYFLIPLVPMLIFYYVAAVYYRASSRELKRLDAIIRSSLYAHFAETLSGLATIRAYREQERFINRNAYFLDMENRPYYLSYAIQRWLGVRLEAIANVLILSTALLGVCGRFTIATATIGLVLSYSMSVTGTFNWCVRQYAEVENNMNAVERLHHYASEQLEAEAPAHIPENRPAESWPSTGAIKIRNLDMRYRPELPLVLRNLSLDIQGGEKIGVVGRTGAGKSSIMMALFRLVEPSAGTMEIDGVDICKLGLFDLRTRLAIIPQDPILFSGTIRSNLDPFNKRTDQELWEALERSDLRNYVASCEGGLDSQVTEFGENLSVGQRQLLCLARAMLTHARVIIMDEATASVDVATDTMLQKAIRVDFAQSTVLTIAHRLNTVIDYSRVLVLDHGEIKEFDTPANLLSRPDSVFASMVDETGPANAALLRSLATAAAEGNNIDVQQVLAAAGNSTTDLSATATAGEAEKKNEKQA